MARIRTIKPEFWTSEQVAECSRDARLLFIGLWNFCDDAGRHQASPKRLKMEVFPGDDISTDLVTEWVRDLVRVGLIEEYEVDGVPYWQVTGWHHQKIDRPYVKLPGQDGTTTQTTVRRLGGKQRGLALRKLIQRDGEKCCNCGSQHNLTIDHITPVCRGGSNDLDNLRILCKPCNNEKHAKVVSGDTDSTREVRTGDSPPEGKGMEGKGEESNGREGKGTPLPPWPSKLDVEERDGIDWMIVEAEFIAKWNSLDGVAMHNRNSFEGTDLAIPFRRDWRDPGWRDRAYAAMSKFPLRNGAKIGLRKFLKDTTIDEILGGVHDFEKRDGNAKPGRSTDPTRVQSARTDGDFANIPVRRLGGESAAGSE